MTKIKRYSADFKAKVALETIREELTLSELSKKYEVHPNMISAWKRPTIENMATTFSKGKETEQRDNDAEIARLHAKIGQLVVERNFLAEASVLLGVNGGKKR
jgi:transposase